MKIMISGSVPKGEAGPSEAFHDACRQIGAALARAKIEIVVGSTETKTADRFVLEGAAQVEGSHRVLFLRPDSDGEPDFGEIQNASRLAVTYRRLRGSWWAGLVPQIQAADAVLIIKGGSGALTTGYIALALERPVIAIGSFGDAGKTLWTEFQPYYDRLGSLTNEVGKLDEAWVPENAGLVVRLAQALIARGTFRTKPRLPMGIYLSLLLSCLVGWVVLFVNPLPVVGYSFFAMLALAGLLGTILRNNLRMVFDPTASFSWNELLIEVGTGLLLGFALALLYLAGMLTVTGNTDVFLLEGAEKGYQRVAVVMTLLGLGGGLMIEQAAERVKRAFSETFDDSKQ